MIFLQWIPWLLRMSRPGEKITRKSILMQKKIKELDKTEVIQIYSPHNTVSMTKTVTMNSTFSGVFQVITGQRFRH